MLTYANSHKQGSCSKETSQAQIMIFCNKDIDTVRSFEDLDWQKLKCFSLSLVLICLHISTRARYRWSWRTVREKSTVYTCLGWNLVQCAQLFSPSSALVPSSSSCVWIQWCTKHQRKNVCWFFFFKWNNSLVFFSGFSLLTVYLIGGFLYQRLIVGAKGMEQFPNYAFWVEVGNLAAVRPEQWKNSF